MRSAFLYVTGIVLSVLLLSYSTLVVFFDPNNKTPLILLYVRFASALFLFTQIYWIALAPLFITYINELMYLS